MLKILGLAGSLALAGLALAPAAATAAPLGNQAAVAETVETGVQSAQYYRRRYGYRRYYGPRRFYGRPYYGPRRYYGPRFYGPGYYGPRRYYW